MANTWSGMTFVNIARKGLSVFKERLIPVNMFTTDFSPDVASQGTQVRTRLVPASTAAADLTGTYSGSRYSAAQDTETTAKTITLNQQPIVGFNLTDEEAGEIGSGVWDDTKNRIITTKVNALGDFVLDYLFNLITASNYSNVAFTGAASTFDLDDVVDIGDTLADANWPVGSLPIFMALKSTYFGAVKKDSAVQDLSASGIPVVMKGSPAVRQIDDFTAVRAPTLPPAGGTPASENLTGFVARPECMIMAMRMVQSQAPEKLVAFEAMVDPDTGISLVYRAAYDPDTGKLYHTFETLFGASVGYDTALQRIRSSE